MAGNWSLVDQGWGLSDWSLLFEADTPEPDAGGSRHPRHRPRTYIEDVIPVDDDDVLVLLALSR